MIYATDVQYHHDHALAVCIAFKEWKQEQVENEYYAKINKVDEYVAGQFYKRELPCILQVLKQAPLVEGDILIVDAYVFLDKVNNPGLGYHLYTQLHKKYPVIGVAKSRFARQAAHVKEVFRGKSRIPLFVSSIGIEPEIAAKHISEMAGTNRIPTLLRLLDKKTKS